MTASLKAGVRTSLETVGTFADGAAVRTIGAETFRICNELVDEMVTLTLTLALALTLTLTRCAPSVTAARRLPWSYGRGLAGVLCSRASKCRWATARQY